MTAQAKDRLGFAAVLVAVIVAGVTIIHVPKSRRLENIRTQIATTQSALEIDTLQASVIPDMEREIERMKNKYKDFDRRLPKRQELGGFLREISENLAQETLVNESYQPGSPVPQELFHTLPIVMKLKGPYLSLASFLKSLDKMERLSRVQMLNVCADPRKGELDITLSINIYFTES